MKAKIAELETLGLVYRNPTATWTSPPHIVPKPGPEKFRFTVDLRVVNASTIPRTWPTPNLADVIQNFAGSKFFGSFDALQGYWQLELAEDSRDCQSIITPFGVFTPTRVLHGTTNATAHMQSGISGIIDPVSENVENYMDDIAPHAETEDEYLDTLDYFLTCFASNDTLLNVLKATLVAKEIIFCGRRISAEGISFEPKCLETLKNLHPPQTGGDLYQFLGAVGWMRSQIPNYAQRVGPLQDLLTIVLDQCPSRTKKSATKVSLRSQWNSDHQQAFKEIISAVNYLMVVALPDPQKVICVFTDASDKFYGGIVTQVLPSELSLPFEEQQHEPLGFSSGAIKGAQLRWGTPEKEGFAILHVVDTFDCILLRAPQFRIFTDHLNLKYIYNPLSVDSTLARHVVHKLQRWALKLSVFNYIIEHIPGEENCWADLLTRFGAGLGALDVPAENVLGTIFEAPPQLSGAKEYKLPSINDYRESQAKAATEGQEHPAGKMLITFTSTSTGKFGSPTRTPTCS